jgi:hypothetical protein
MTSPAAQPPMPPRVGGAIRWQRPLPPVELVRPGLWSVPVPLPNTSLRYVLVYVFETPAGPYLVDAGWDTDEAYDTISAGLTTVGSRMAFAHLRALARRGVIIEEPGETARWLLRTGSPIPPGDPER